MANESGAAQGRSQGRKKRSVWRGILKVIGWILLTVFTILVIGVATAGIFTNYFMTYINNVLRPTVDTPQLEAITMNLASTLYCKNPETGEWMVMRAIAGQEANRELIEYTDLPKHLIDAVVSIEDHRFWEHKGVDWVGTIRATLSSVTGSGTQGGSTITQQMIRNATKDTEVTVKRKFREILRSLDFDANNSKEDILTLYLNYVYFGQNCNGIQTAAKKYFGKDVSQLDLAESAAIVGITNNPSLYDPYYRKEYTLADGTKKSTRQYNKERQELILDEMVKYGKITQAEADAAKAETLLFTDTEEYKALHADDPVAVNETGSTYTWYEDAVIDDATSLLAEALGVGEEVANQMLFRGGYHIYTALDMNVQEVVDEIYTDPSNFDYPSKKGTQLDSGITVLDYYTGDVVAMAGGVGEKESSLSLSLSRAPRPVGSAIKPVAVYAPAIEYDVVGPGSIVDDYPYKLNDAGTGGYPKNSNGHYRGPVSVAYGVQWSLNTVACRVVQMVGTTRAYEFMENNLGFDLVEADKDVSPLAMGSLTHGVSTEQMAAAFGAFANSGIYTKPRTVVRIETNDHTQVVVDNQSQSSVAMKESTAYLMTQMLRKVASAGTGASMSFPGMHIAGKTGTTDDNYDRYFVGYTPYYSAAVWVGYPKSNEKIPTDRGNPAGNVWKLVMEKLHENLEDKSFPEAPSGITTANICMDCGKLAGDLCSKDYRGSRVATGEFPTGAVPTEHCTCHVTVQMCKPGAVVKAPEAGAEEGAEAGTEDAAPVEDDGAAYLAGAYCPQENQFSRVMLAGRDFLMVPSGNVRTMSDGSTVTGDPIVSDDADAHLNYFSWTVGSCPVHDENYVPEPSLPEDDPSLPPDDGSQIPGVDPPDWTFPWGDGEDPGGAEEPGEPDEPQDPGTGSADDPGTTADPGATSDPGKTAADPEEPDGGTEPDEPSLPDEPAEP